MLTSKDFHSVLNTLIKFAVNFPNVYRTNLWLVKLCSLSSLSTRDVLHNIYFIASLSVVSERSFARRVMWHLCHYLSNCLPFSCDTLHPVRVCLYLPVHQSLCVCLFPLPALAYPRGVLFWIVRRYWHWLKVKYWPYDHGQTSLSTHLSLSLSLSHCI